MIEAQQIERFNRAKVRLKMLLEKTMLDYADANLSTDPVWAPMKQAKTGVLQLVDRVHELESAREKLRLKMENVGRIAMEAMEDKDRALMLLVRRTEDERAKRSKGGKARAAKLKDQPIMPDWMLDLFERAYVEIERDGKARVGHVALLGVAWREAGPDHPHRDELTEHRARQYLKTRPKLPR